MLRHNSSGGHHTKSKKFITTSSSKRQVNITHRQTTLHINPSQRPSHGESYHGLPFLCNRLHSTQHRFRSTSTFPSAHTIHNHPQSSKKTESTHPLHIASQIASLFPSYSYGEQTAGLSLHNAKPQKHLSNTPGMFGLRGVSKPDDLDRLYLEKLSYIEACAYRLLTIPTNQQQSLQWVDDMSKLLCDIADGCEAIRSFHTNISVLNKANSLHQDAQSLLAQWSGSPIVLLTLYNIIRTKEIWTNLTTEGQRVVLDLLSRMHMNTVISPKEHAELVPLTYTAEEKFVTDSGNFKRNWIDIPNSILNTATAADQQFMSKYARFFKTKSRLMMLRPGSGESGAKQYFIDPGFTQTLLANIESRPLRQFFYSQQDTPFIHQLNNLKDLVQSRHIKAVCEGSLSHAHLQCASNLSKVPTIPVQYVSQFLDNIRTARGNEYRLMAEYLVLEDRFKGIANDNIEKIDKNQKSQQELYQWDIPYVTKQMNLLVNSDMAKVSEYLQLDSVLHGIGLILNLMGVELEVHEINQNEAWSHVYHNKPLDPNTNNTNDNPVTNSSYHYAIHHNRHNSPDTWCSISDIHKNHRLIAQDAFKLHYVDRQSGGLLGVLYVDPYARETKHSGAAQYVVSCGRMRHSHPDDPPTTPFFLLNENEIIQNIQTNLTPSEYLARNYELPVSVLTTYIDKHSSRHSKLPLLTLEDLRVFSHEIGHSAHAFLSRTQFQHFAGPRCEMDFVEMPSTLFETISEDPRFISLFARHNITNEPIPKQLLESIELSHAIFPAYTQTITGVYSLIDQRLFGLEYIQDDNNWIEPFGKLFDLHYTENNENNKDKQQLSNNLQNFHEGLSINQPLTPKVLLDTMFNITNFSKQPFKDFMMRYNHSHATPQQTTLIAHTIFNRYGDMDIHEKGSGVNFNISSTHDNNEKSVKLQETSKDNKNNPPYCQKITYTDNTTLFTPPTALTKSTKVYPHATHTHLSHYGGFYFSYLYCKAFALLIKNSIFEPIFNNPTIMQSLSAQTTSANNPNASKIMLPTTPQGLLFKNKVLAAGGSESGLDIMSEILYKENTDDSIKRLHKNVPKLPRFPWPSEIFQVETYIDENGVINTVGSAILKSENEEKTSHKSETSLVSQKLTPVYDLLTSFQGAVRWKLDLSQHPALARDVLSPQQLLVLDQAFRSLEDHIIAQSNRGVQYMRTKLNFDQNKKMD